MDRVGISDYIAAFVNGALKSIVLKHPDSHVVNVLNDVSLAFAANGKLRREVQSSSGYRLFDMVSLSRKFAKLYSASSKVLGAWSIHEHFL